MFSVKTSFLSTQEVASDGRTLGDGKTRLTLQEGGERWSFEGEESQHPFGEYYKSDKGEIVAIVPIPIHGIPRELEKILREKGADLISTRSLAGSSHS